MLDYVRQHGVPDLSLDAGTLKAALGNDTVIELGSMNPETAARAFEAFRMNDMTFVELR